MCGNGKQIEEELNKSIERFQVNVILWEGRHLPLKNADPKVIVSIGRAKKTIHSKSNKTDCLYFNDFCIFPLKLPLNVLLDKILKIKVYHKSSKKKLIGSFKVELATVWSQPNHQFYHKWAVLVDPKSPAAGVKGFIKCDIVILSKDMTVKRGAECDGYLEDNLLVPYGGIKNRLRTRVILSVYRADSFSPTLSGKFRTTKPFIRITYGGNVRKTSRAKGRGAPVWNEELIFLDMFPPLMQNLFIEICDLHSSEESLGNTTIDIRSLYEDGNNGFLPTFGPNFLYLYEPVGKFQRHKNTFPAENSFTYAARLLLSLRTEVIEKFDKEILPKRKLKIGPEKIPPMIEQMYFEYNNFILFAAIFDALLFDAKPRKIKIQLTMGPKKRVEKLKIKGGEKKRKQTPTRIKTEEPLRRKKKRLKEKKKASLKKKKKVPPTKWSDTVSETEPEISLEKEQINLRKKKKERLKKRKKVPSKKRIDTASETESEIPMENKQISLRKKKKKRLRKKKKVPLKKEIETASETEPEIPVENKQINLRKKKKERLRKKKKVPSKKGIDTASETESEIPLEKGRKGLRKKKKERLKKKKKVPSKKSIDTASETEPEIPVEKGRKRLRKKKKERLKKKKKVPSKKRIDTASETESEISLEKGRKRLRKKKKERLKKKKKVPSQKSIDTASETESEIPLEKGRKGLRRKKKKRLKKKKKVPSKKGIETASETEPDIPIRKEQKQMNEKKKELLEETEKVPSKKGIETASETQPDIPIRKEQKYLNDKNKELLKEPEKISSIKWIQPPSETHPETLLEEEIKCLSYKTIGPSEKGIQTLSEIATQTASEKEIQTALGPKPLITFGKEQRRLKEKIKRPFEVIKNIFSKKGTETATETKPQTLLRKDQKGLKKKIKKRLDVMEKNIQTISEQGMQTICEMGTQTFSETKPEIPLKTKTETPLETKPETSSKTKTETPLETKPETSSKTKTETPLETKPETSLKTKTETPLETKPETSSKTKSETPLETKESVSKKKRKGASRKKTPRKKVVSKKKRRSKKKKKLSVTTSDKEDDKSLIKNSQEPPKKETDLKEQIKPNSIKKCEKATQVTEPSVEQTPLVIKEKQDVTSQTNLKCLEKPPLTTGKQQPLATAEKHIESLQSNLKGIEKPPLTTEKQQPLAPAEKHDVSLQTNPKCIEKPPLTTGKQQPLAPAETHIESLQNNFKGIEKPPLTTEKQQPLAPAEKNIESLQSNLKGIEKPSLTTEKQQPLAPAEKHDVSLQTDLECKEKHPLASKKRHTKPLKIGRKRSKKKLRGVKKKKKRKEHHSFLERRRKKKALKKLNVITNSDTTTIVTFPVAKGYSYVQYSGNFPCINLFGQWPNSLKRMYCCNVIKKAIQNWTNEINKIKDDLQSQPCSKSPQKLNATLANLSESCENILLLTRVIKLDETDLSRERRRYYDKEIADIAEKIKRASTQKPLKAEKELNKIATYLAKLTKYAQDPENSFPNTEIWLLSGNRTLAQHRIKTEDVAYSEDFNYRGIMSGKTQTILCRGKKGKIKAKLEILIWFGLAENFEECLKILPNGLNQSNAIYSKEANVNIPYRLIIDEKHDFQCKMHIFQGKIFFGFDNSGLSNTFVRVIFRGQSKITKMCRKTLNPVWDETLVFHVTLYGPTNYIKENPPCVTVEVFDKRKRNKFQLIGRCFIAPLINFNEDKETPPPKLKWVSIMSEVREVGQILMAGELLEIADNFKAPPYSVPVPENIRPHNVKYKLEILFWGVRPLRAVKSIKNKVFVILECGESLVKSPVMRNIRHTLNFSGLIQEVKLNLPEELVYAPPLNIKLFHIGSVAHTRNYVATCMVPSIRNILSPKAPCPCLEKEEGAGGAGGGAGGEGEEEEEEKKEEEKKSSVLLKEKKKSWHSKYEEKKNFLLKIYEEEVQKKLFKTFEGKKNWFVETYEKKKKNWSKKKVKLPDDGKKRGFELLNLEFCECSKYVNKIRGLDTNAPGKSNNVSPNYQPNLPNPPNTTDTCIPCCEFDSGYTPQKFELLNPPVDSDSYNSPYKFESLNPPVASEMPKPTEKSELLNPPDGSEQCVPPDIYKPLNPPVDSDSYNPPYKFESLNPPVASEKPKPTEKSELLNPLDKSEQCDAPDNSKPLNPPVKSKTSKPPNKSKPLKPPFFYLWCDPPDNSQCLTPSIKSELLNPLDESEQCDAPDNSKPLNPPVESMTSKPPDKSEPSIPPDELEPCESDTCDPNDESEMCDPLTNFNVFYNPNIPNMDIKRDKVKKPGVEDEEECKWWTRYRISEECRKESLKFSRIKIYKEELEVQPEFNGFQDFLQNYVMVTEHKKGIKAVAKVKVALKFQKYTKEPEKEKGFLLTSFSNHALKFIVRIYVVCGKNLTPRQIYGKSNPYLFLQLGKQIISGKKLYVSQQCNPTFGTCFEFQGIFPQDYLLNIKVFDRKIKSKDELIGETTIDLENRFYSKFHATCGLASSYVRHEWRDIYFPSEILRMLCKQLNFDEPVYEDKTVVIEGYTFKTPVSDDEENKVEAQSLMVLKKWHKMPIYGFHLVPEHVEARSLYHPSLKGMEQGKLVLWVDIFPADLTNMPPVVDIRPQPPVAMELRAIVWNVVDVMLDDKSLQISDRISDIYVKGWILFLEEDIQKTDIHYRSLNGEGNFNWRFIFHFNYIPIERRMTVTKKVNVCDLRPEERKVQCKLEIQVWDNDAFGDDFLGTLILELCSMPSGAKLPSRCTLKMLAPNAGTINLFKIKKTRGWWPFRRLKVKETLDNEFELSGKIDLELEILTEEEAKKSPAGRGRKKPKPLPPPDRHFTPEISTNKIVTPVKVASSISSTSTITLSKAKNYIYAIVILMVIIFFLIALYVFQIS